VEKLGREDVPERVVQRLEVVQTRSAASDHTSLTRRMRPLFSRRMLRRSLPERRSEAGGANDRS
jgi:hypothetical protein